MASSTTMDDEGTLNYDIYKCSAHSGQYVAQNIITDDKTTRWSGAYPSSTKQWIMLRLDKPSVVKSITFGKHSKPHPCNTKEFRVLVGLSDDNMTVALNAELRNDKENETFSIKVVNKEGVYIPTRYIKIIPLSSHGSGFHTSIWFVSVAGIANERFLDQVKADYEEHSEVLAMRHVLKHLRKRRLLGAYENILSRSNLEVEHPLVTTLYQSLVLQGDWSRTEELVLKMSDLGLFEQYLKSSQPVAFWKRILGMDADGDRPSPRGGHAMCIDQGSGVIYLFGGWDGQKSLDDFWSYDISQDRWKVLSHGTAAQSGPSARSCHKMVFDPKTGALYVLGNLDSPSTDGDTSQPSGTAQNPQTKIIPSDFYKYNTRGVDAGSWQRLSRDTAADGGPSLIFDHQMVMDSHTQTIYVFGGRVVDGNWDNMRLSGLYSYHTPSDKWSHIKQSGGMSIPSRYGHSMVLEPSSQTLYIFAGQRDDSYLSDMYSYDIDANTSTQLFSNFTANEGPEACFTQRAVIDSDLKEIYVFCGLTRGQQTGSSTVLSSGSPNWVYSYHQRHPKWAQILSSKSPRAKALLGQHAFPDHPLESPQTRYAHQVVYHASAKTLYLHGGNGGLLDQPMEGKAEGTSDSEHKSRRLDDFWSMKMRRPSVEEVIRKARFQIRRQSFREMCNSSTPIKALHFLQNEVAQVVNHGDVVEAESFRSLLTFLVSPTTPISSTSFGNTESEAGQPPRKRSRSHSPEEVRLKEARPSSSKFRTSILRNLEDPVEEQLRGSGTGETDWTAPSGDVYAQRTEVFEKILELVSDDAKQPSGNLVDFIGTIDD